MSTKDPRLLLVVSGAYGDLSLAVSFVYGQEFASQTALALPPPLYVVNRDSLPLQVYQYRSVEDILHAAATWEARVVVLLSGYGFPIEKLTSPPGVGRLVRHLRRRNCCVVTTDPFLGSASTVRGPEIRAMLPPPTAWWHKLLVAFMARRVAGLLNRSSNVLRDVVHLYPAPIDSLDNPGRLPRTSFFNPRLTQAASGWDDSANRYGTTTGAPSSERVWLFLLAPSDVAMQQRKWGSGAFVSQLVHMFEQTRCAGRRPVLVGPPWLLQDMTGVVPASLQAELVQFCSYQEFVSRLLNAEYAFYWNLFSCSAGLVRLVRKLPVFFFDQGHVGQFDRRIYQDGVRCYYGGWEPQRLRQGDLDTEVLAEAAASQERGVDALLAYWKQSPTPRQVIDRLLDGTALEPSEV